MARKLGRVRPYDLKEVGRVKCAGCGGRAIHQWNCCANNNRFVAVCLDCDFALNEMTLAFFRVPRRAALLASYRRRRVPH